MLATEGALVIYVDLWEDKAVDPAKVVIEGIRKAILGLEGMVLKGAKASGLTRFKVVGFEMDLAAIGTPDGMTISAALQVLSKMARKPIFLVIDEAQHAQTTEAGRAMLFALKAARDALMLDRSLFGFRLLATGSNSDKLTALINSKDQAFYKAPLEQLEPLGDDYLAWLRKTRGRQPMPAKGVLKQGFERMGHRPEPLKGVLKDLLKRSPGAAQADIDAQFLSLVEASLEADRDLFLRSIEGRDPWMRPCCSAWRRSTSSRLSTRLRWKAIAAQERRARRTTTRPSASPRCSRRWSGCARTGWSGTMAAAPGSSRTASMPPGCVRAEQVSGRPSGVGGRDGRPELPGPAIARG